MRSDTRTEYRERIESLVAYISANLDHDLPLNHLAHVAGFSPYHFHRLFRAVTGETLRDLVWRLRMERAAYRLVHEKHAIAHVGVDAGYETAASFTRAFRNAFKVAPSDFRKLAVGRAHDPQTFYLQSPSGAHFRADGTPPSLLYRPLGDNPVQTEIRSLNPRTYAYLRHIGPYHEIGGAFAKLHPLARAAGVRAGAPIAIYHDDPDSTPQHLLRSDAGVMLEEGAAPVEPVGDLQVGFLPAGDYAVGTYVGPYRGLGDAWAWFMSEGVASTGRELGDGPCFEVYLNDCTDVPEDQLRTEIWVSVR